MTKLVLAGLMFGLLLLVACSINVAPAEVTALPADQQQGLWVSGTGKASGVPDVVLLQLGIEAQAKTVAQAQDLAGGAMSRVQQALKDKGVADKDVQTLRFSIQPVTEWVDEGNRKGRQVIVGYQVTNLIIVKVRQVNRAGEVIDAVAVAGGDLTRIQSISFTIDDPSSLYNEARQKAIQDAQAKAGQMAELLGVELGKPIYISESAPAIPGPQPLRLEAVAGEAVTPISPGELEIRLTVQVRYNIQ